MSSGIEEDMSCNEMEGRLVEYLDGLARPAERRVIEQHLAFCVECRNRAHEFQAVWSALGDVPTISPSPAFDASLRARLAAEPARQSFWSWLPSPRLAFAMIVLIAVSAWVSSMPQATHDQAMPSLIGNEAEFQMISDLPELENYELLSKFDVLSELPVPMDTVVPDSVAGKKNQ
jgi:anti-sigma factor RsiW